MADDNANEAQQQHSDGRRRAKPQVFSLFQPVPPKPPTHLSLAQEPAAASAQGAQINNNNNDDKTRYRSLPATQPGVAIAAGAEHWEPRTPPTTTTSRNNNNKSKYRSPPASRPGVVSARTVQAAARDNNDEWADEPEPLATNTATSANNQKPTTHRRNRPGAVAAGGQCHETNHDDSDNNDDDDDERESMFLAKERERLKAEASLIEEQQQQQRQSVVRNSRSQRGPTSMTEKNGDHNQNNNKSRLTRRQMEDKLYAMELQMTNQQAAEGFSSEDDDDDDDYGDDREADEEDLTSFQDEHDDDEDDNEHGIVSTTAASASGSRYSQLQFPEEAAPDNQSLYVQKAYEGDSQQMVTAFEVDEDEERKLLQSAEDFDPKHARRLYQRPCFMCLVMVLVCGGIAGLVVGLTVVRDELQSDDDKEDAFVTEPPSYAPTVTPTTMYEVQLRSWLDGLNISKATLEYAPVAYDLAVEWHANVDPAVNRSLLSLSSISSSSPNATVPWDFTRFILAWVYYTSSSNGTLPWFSCNPPDYARGDNDTCTFLRFVSASSDRRYLNFTQVKQSQRWLSGAHACLWPGVECFGQIVPEGHPYEACNFAPTGFFLIGMGLTGQFPIMLNQLDCPMAMLVAWNPGLTGSLSPELFNFRSAIPQFLLQQVGLINNTGMGGKFPDTIWGLQGLYHLEVGDNGFTGTLPQLFGPAYPLLQNLWFFGESLGDTPLPELNGFPNLRSVRFHRDSIGFNHTIPSSYGSLQTLSELWLYENRLSGAVPSSLASLPFLQDLRIGRNRLNGTFPDAFWPFMERLEVNTNSLEGELPKQLANMTGLSTLSLSQNRFRGTLDPEIGNKLINMKVLFVDDNLLTGPIPPTLSNMGQLTALWLHYNKFTGSFPIEICNLRSTDGLAFIQADCLAYPPQVFCFCCTSCCDFQYRSCQRYFIERENAIDLSGRRLGGNAVDVLGLQLEERSRPRKKYSVEREEHFDVAHFDNLRNQLKQNLKSSPFFRDSG